MFYPERQYLHYYNYIKKQEALPRHIGQAGPFLLFNDVCSIVKSYSEELDSQHSSHYFLKVSPLLLKNLEL